MIVIYVFIFGFDAILLFSLEVGLLEVTADIL